MTEKEPILPVTSKNPENTSFGTAFVIHRDETGIWFLTCNHVLENVGGPDSARIGGEPVEVVSVKPEGASDPDMAVLKVKADWKLSPLPCGAVGSEGMTIRVPGFKEYRKDFLLRPVQGTLGVSMEITPKDSVERVKARSLVMDDGSRLKPGYSGSPVIDPESGRVLAIASDMLGKGETGVAVSIRALASVWPDMPEDLLEETGISASQPRDTERGFLRNTARYRCDRDEQVKRFERFFETCRQGECADHPQFYFIHGDEGECHEELVERFRTYELRICVNRESRGEDAVRPSLDVPFPLLKSREDVEEELVRGLFRAVFPEYNGKTGPEDFRKLDGIREYKVVPVVHNIPVEHWKPFFPALLRSYMENFWMGSPDFIDSPLFLVFFLFEYPRADDAGVIKRWAVRKRRTRIQRELSALEKGMTDICRCLLLPELGPVDEYSVEAWCKQFVSRDRVLWKKRVEQFFRDAPMRMEKVEELIIEFLDTMKSDDLKHYAD